MQNEWYDENHQIYHMVVVSRFHMSEDFNRALSVILKDHYNLFCYLILAIRKANHQFLAYLLDRCTESGMRNLDKLIEKGVTVDHFSPGHPFNAISLLDMAYDYEKSSIDYPMIAQLFRVANQGKMEEMLIADNYRLFKALISGRKLSNQIILRMASALPYHQLIRLQSELVSMRVSSAQNLVVCMKMIEAMNTSTINSQASANLYQKLVCAFELAIHEYRLRHPSEEDIKLQRMMALYNEKLSSLTTYLLLDMTHERVASLLSEIREILAVKNIPCWWPAKSLDRFNQQPLVVEIEQALEARSRRASHIGRPY